MPRITFNSIANNEEPEMVALVDQPEMNRKVTRVCGLFAVEATIQAAAVLDEALSPDPSPASGRGETRAVTYVSVTPDVVVADLLKTSHTDQKGAVRR